MAKTKEFPWLKSFPAVQERKKRKEWEEGRERRAGSGRVKFVVNGRSWEGGTEEQFILRATSNIYYKEPNHHRIRARVWTVKKTILLVYEGRSISNTPDPLPVV